jgi:hypothetical protein
MSLESYVQAAPKAELHVHLEGAIQPASVLALAQRNNIPLPVENEEGLRRLFAYRDFEHFIEIFMMVTRCLKTREDYRSQAGGRLATMAIRRLRRLGQRELGNAPAAIYLAGCYGVFALEELLSLLGSPVRESFLPAIKRTSSPDTPIYSGVQKL